MSNNFLDLYTSLRPYVSRAITTTTVEALRWRSHPLLLVNIILLLIFVCAIGEYSFLWVFVPIIVRAYSLSEAVANFFDIAIARIADRFKSIMIPLEQGVNNISIGVEASVNRISDRLTDVVSQESFSWENVVYNAQTHPLGLIGACSIISNAESPRGVVEGIGVAASLLGFEKSLMTSAFGVVGTPFKSTMRKGIFAQQQGIEDLLKDFGDTSSWTKKRTVGVTALGLSMLNKDVSSFLEPISKAVKHQKAIEAAWDTCEEYFNDLGIISSGKYAYLKELSEAYSELRDRTLMYNQVLATGGSAFCKADFYRGYLDFRKDIDTIDKLLNKNTMADLRSTNLHISLSQLKMKVEGWDATIANLRATKAIRPVPTGVCIWSRDSHIGKTELISELISRVKVRLEQEAAKSPDLCAFSNAKKWTKWNVQQRDEFDTGYAGDEITYMDDAFSDVENKDHPMMLTFISGEGIGTVGAALGDKGKPYSSRLFICTANSLPQSSVSINNVHAVHERFPLCVQVKAVDKVPGQGDPYDHDFKHLAFHVNPMSTHCGMVRTSRSKTHNASSCSFPINGAATCGQSVTRNVEDLVNMIVEDLLFRDEQYRARFAHMFAQEQADFETAHDRFDPEDWESISEDSDRSFSPLNWDDLLGSVSFSSRAESLESDRDCEDEDSDEETLDDYSIGVPCPDPAQEAFERRKRFLVTDRANKCLGTKEFELICSAYRKKPIESACDYRLVALYPYFQRIRDKRSLLDCLSDGPIHDPVDLIRYLQYFKVKEDMMEDFQVAWRGLTSGGIRVHGSDGACLFAWEIDFGMQVLPVPKLEGIVTVFDRLNEKHEPILLLATYLSCQDVQRLRNNDFCVWRCRETIDVWLHGEIQKQVKGLKMPIFKFLTGFAIAVKASDMIALTVQFACRKFGLPCYPRVISATFMHNLAERMTGLVLHNPWPACTLINNLYERSTIWKPLKDVLWGCAAPLAYFSDKFSQITKALDNMCKILSDFCSWVIIRVAEFFGIEITPTLEWLCGAVGTVAATVVAGAFITLIISIIRWCFIKYVVYSHKQRAGTNHSLTSNRVKRQSKRKVVRNQSLTRGFSRKSRRIRSAKQQNLFLDLIETAIKEEKPDFYQDPDLECPFCDDDVLDEVECIEYETGYYFRKNKYPRAPNHWMVIPVEHADKCWGEDLTQEFDWIMEQKAERNLGCVFVEKSLGPFGGGTVPHSHTHLMWEDDILYPPIELHTDYQISSVKVYKAGKARSIEIIVWLSNDHFGDVITALTPLYEQLGKPSYSFDGYVGQVHTELCLYFSTTFKEGEERYLQKSDVDQLKPILDDLGGLNPLLVYDVIHETQAPVEEQGLDDAAVALMKGLVASHQVQVVRVGASPHQRMSDYSDFDTSLGATSAAIASGEECFFPHHIAETGSYVKVYRLGDKPLARAAELKNMPYFVYLVTKHSALHQLARAVIVTKRQLQADMEKLGIESSLPNMHASCDPHARWIDTHAMTDDELAHASCGNPALQWHPTVALLSVCRLGAVESVKFNFPDHSEIHRVVNVIAGSTDASTTRPGDCGGFVCVANTRFPRKFIGFHCIGNDSSQWTTILTREQLSFIRSSDSEQGFPPDPEIEVYTDVTNVEMVSFESGNNAGLGHTQINCWPKIEWGISPSFGLVAPGVGPDVPVGPCVSPVGLLRYDQRAESSSTDKWKQSPFFGVFPIQLLPSVQHIGDRRREVPLPVNRLGNETLLWPNFKMAQTSGSVDLTLFNECVNAYLKWYKGVFAADQVSNPDRSLEYALEVGLNGVPYGKHCTGIVLNASAGVPWNGFEGFRKKSDFVGCDEEGHRSFLDNSSGRIMKIYCSSKLSQARHLKRIPSFIASKLKDCLVKEKHVVNGKTRVFDCSAVESIICSNALFAHFKEAFIAKRLELNHAIGIDVNSVEWDHLWRYVQYHPNVFDVDFQNFDKNLRSLFLRAGFTIVIETIRSLDDDGWSNARYVLCEDDINSLMVDNRSVYITEHSNKSGCSWTTPINGIVNSLMLFYCFSKWLGRVDLSFFFEHTRHVTFGDDKLVSVSDVCIDFNRTLYAKLLLEFGQVLTGASKDSGELTPWVSWEDAQFLKGTTVSLSGIYVYALERASIEATFGWSQVQTHQHDIWFEIVRSHLSAAIPHGEEYFTYFRESLYNRVCERRFDAGLRKVLLPLLTISYSQAFSAFRDKLVGISVS